MQPTAAQLATTGGKAVEGAWYGGQRYMGGSLLAPGQDQAGHDVSAEVIAQTNPNNVAYVNNQRANAGMTPSPSSSNPNSGNASGGGLSGLMGGGGTPNTPNLQSIYDAAYTNDPTVKASQANLAALQKQVADKQTARDTALADINDNPFYSEGNRTGRAAKVNDAYNNDATTLTNQINTEQGNLTSKQAEAERQVNLATGQYNLNSQAYQQNLSNFNMLLNAGAFVNATPSDLSTISAQTGISPSMLQSIQQVSQQKMISPQIVTSTDGSGNVHITAVDKNTGKIINEEVLGGAGKGSGGSSSTSTTKNIVQTFATSVSSSKGISSNGTYVGVFPQLVAQYAPYMSLQDIYKTYASTPQGKQWGTPKESSALINQIYQQARKGTAPVQ